MGNEQLRKLVRRRVMSQKQVAAEIGISNIHFNYWINGKKDLSQRSKDKVEAFLGIKKGL